MRNPPAPRDLEARVRAGIEQTGSRRTWFVGLSASVATVIAAIAVVALIGRLPDEPGGSPAPSASESEIASPSAVPATATPEPSAAAAFLAPGDMGYLVLSGDVGSQQLVFHNDANRRRDHRDHAIRRDPCRGALARRPVAGVHLGKGRVRRQGSLGAQPCLTASRCASAAARSSPSPIAWHGPRTARCSRTPWTPSTSGRPSAATHWKPIPIRSMSGSSTPGHARPGA